MPVDVGQASSALVAFPTFSRSPMSVSHAHCICCTFWMRFVNGLLGRCGLLLKIRMPMSPQYSTAHPPCSLGALRCHRTCSVSGSFPMEALRAPSRLCSFPRDLTVRFGRLRQGTFQRASSMLSLHSGPHKSTSIRSLATRRPHPEDPVISFVHVPLNKPFLFLASPSPSREIKPGESGLPGARLLRGGHFVDIGDLGARIHSLYMDGQLKQ
jgi:hypothetical protein